MSVQMQKFSILNKWYNDSSLEQVKGCARESATLRALQSVRVSASVSVSVCLCVQSVSLCAGLVAGGKTRSFGNHETKPAFDVRAEGGGPHAQKPHRSLTPASGVLRRWI